MIDINREVSKLIKYGLDNELFNERDKIYCTNRVIALLGLNEIEIVDIKDESPELPTDILNNILNWSYENGVLEENGTVYRDNFDTEIMACLMPRPSEVTDKFYSIYAQNRKKASDYYYTLSYKSNYIRMDRIRRNLVWKADTKYGQIDLSINLSKPEKDPKAIAAALQMPSSSYPKCLLCKENEGYKGTLTHPARGNHRIIPLEICGEKWFFQYSPYGYFNEHCILFKGSHDPMKITGLTLDRLLSFVEFMPHYFIGSNAGIPIVGGSILTHDHYQGGNYEFPMAKAPVERSFSVNGFEDVEAGIVKWPMSCIRIKSTDKKRVLALGTHILESWESYSDERAFIIARTPDGEIHNAITPIARFRSGKFELDLVLRNNITTEEFPMGYYHPHPEYHHIKKENIGLIEVMGLAVLPARLKNSIEKMELALKNENQAENIFEQDEMKIHYDWYKELKAKNIPHDEINRAIKQSIGEIFAEILANAGVYKDTPQGREAFDRFCASL